MEALQVVDFPIYLNLLEVSGWLPRGVNTADAFEVRILRDLHRDEGGVSVPLPRSMWFPKDTTIALQKKRGFC